MDNFSLTGLASYCCCTFNNETEELTDGKTWVKDLTVEVSCPWGMTSLISKSVTGLRMLLVQFQEDCKYRAKWDSHIACKQIAHHPTARETSRNNAKVKRKMMKILLANDAMRHIICFIALGWFPSTKKYIRKSNKHFVEN